MPLEGAELEAHLKAQDSPPDVIVSAANDQTDQALHMCALPTLLT